MEQERHPVSYISHRISETEMSWNTGDQELLTVITSLQKWDVCLRGANFLLLEDHEPIRFLHKKSKLSLRHQRWLYIL